MKFSLWSHSLFQRTYSDIENYRSVWHQAHYNITDNTILHFTVTVGSSTTSNNSYLKMSVKWPIACHCSQFIKKDCLKAFLTFAIVFIYYSNLQLSFLEFCFMNSAVDNQCPSGPSLQHNRPPGKAVHWGPYLHNHSQELNC